MISFYVDRAWLAMGQQAEEADAGDEAMLCYWIALEVGYRRAVEQTARATCVTSSGAGYFGANVFHIVT